MRFTTMLGTFSVMAAVIAAAAVGAQQLASAQPRPKPATHHVKQETSRVMQAATAMPAKAASRPSEWISRCASATRHTVPQCFIKQTAVLTKTGQTVASVTVRVPPDDAKPLLMIQVPVGLYLPAGITIKIDDAAPKKLVVQTCDLKGCYAGEQVTAEMLRSLRSGK